MTPVRDVCQNTLNLAIHDAKIIWTTNHTGDISLKLKEVMKKLGDEAYALSQKSLTDKKVISFIEELIPLTDNASKLQENNVDLLRTYLK